MMKRSRTILTLALALAATACGEPPGRQDGPVRPLAGQRPPKG